MTDDLENTPPNPARAPTTAERLCEVQNAIQTIVLTGQSYQIGTRRLTRADLLALRQLERDLKDELASEESEGGLLRFTVNAAFSRR